MSHLALVNPGNVILNKRLLRNEGYGRSARLHRFHQIEPRPDDVAVQILMNHKDVYLSSIDSDPELELP